MKIGEKIDMLFFGGKPRPMDLANMVFRELLTDEEREMIRLGNPELDLEKFIFEMADESRSKYPMEKSMGIIYRTVIKMRNGASKFEMRNLILDLFLELFDRKNRFFLW